MCFFFIFYRGTPRDSRIRPGRSGCPGVVGGGWLGSRGDGDGLHVDDVGDGGGSGLVEGGSDVDRSVFNRPVFRVGGSVDRSRATGTGRESGCVGLFALLQTCEANESRLIVVV